MIVQAICQNLSSTNSKIQEQGDQLMGLLEQTTDANLLLQPVVIQINLQNQKSKAYLVQKLCGILERVQKQQLVNKYVLPLLQPTSKVQQEAKGNIQLREALQMLGKCVQ